MFMYNIGMEAERYHGQPRISLCSSASIFIYVCDLNTCTHCIEAEKLNISHERIKEFVVG